MTIYEAAIRTVCIAFEITPQLLQSRDRSKRLVEARQWYSMLTRKRPCERAGLHIRRDHATMVHHRREIRDLIGIYPIYREKWQIIQCLFERVLVADASRCNVTLSQYRGQWHEYRDLLAAVAIARAELEALSTEVMRDSCVVQECRDGDFLLRRKNLEGEPISLSEVLSIIRKRNN